mgnify:FL=1|tara:strand:- start:640 stop:1194 length:555 start_codon:yes stop_codon:yes gene_type:complete
MARSDYRIEVDIKKALKSLGAIPSIVQEESEAMALEVAEFGENEMKAIILTSGTAFSDAARSAGINKGPGRFRTGKMYNSVKSKVLVNGSNVSATYGWLGQIRKYFLYQEYGFRNQFIASYSGSGVLRVDGGSPVVRRNPHGGYKNTPGMFAFRDSQKSVEKELPRLLKKYRGRITRRINKGEK